MKTSDERQYGRKVAECIRYCLLGAVAAGAILSFFDIWHEMAYFENTFSALFALGALYGALLWARTKCGAWISIAVFVVPLLALTILAASASVVPIEIVVAWLMPRAFMLALLLELSHRTASKLPFAILSGSRGRYPVAGTLVLVGAGILVGAGVPFLIFTNFLHASPTTSTEGAVFGVAVEIDADLFVPLGIAAGLFSGIAATAYRRSITDGLAIGVVTLFGVGLFTSINIDLDYVVYTVEVGLLVLGGLVASVIAALFLRAPASGEADVRSARLALRDDLYAALTATVAIVAPVFVFLGLGIGGVFGVADMSLAGSFVAATLFGLGFGLIGRRAWYRYRLGHALAVAKRDLPPRLLSFMDWRSMLGCSGRAARLTSSATCNCRTGYCTTLNPRSIMIPR